MQVPVQAPVQLQRRTTSSKPGRASSIGVDIGSGVGLGALVMETYVPFQVSEVPFPCSSCSCSTVGDGRTARFLFAVTALLQGNCNVISDS